MGKNLFKPCVREKNNFFLLIDEKDEDVRENLLRLAKPLTLFKMNVQGLIKKIRLVGKEKNKKNKIIQHEMSMQQTGVVTEKVIVCGL